MTTDYGLSAHYDREKGRAYFEQRQPARDLNGEIESHKFSPWVKPADVVLDFGCAGGYVLKALHCLRRLGVEPNPDARAQAIANGIECFSSLGEAPDGIADVGLTNHVLEHVPFPIEALRQFKRKIKPGGLALICVPMEDWRACRHYKQGDMRHHLYAWNPLLLGNLLEEAGFAVNPESIAILTHAYPPRLHAYLYRRLPLGAFNALCGLSARLLKRRQLFAHLQV